MSTAKLYDLNELLGIVKSKCKHVHVYVYIYVVYTSFAGRNRQFSPSSLFSLILYVFLSVSLCLSLSLKQTEVHVGGMVVNYYWPTSVVVQFINARALGCEVHFPVSDIGDDLGHS